MFQRHVVVIDRRLVAERLRQLYIGALDIRWICMSRPHYYVWICMYEHWCYEHVWIYTFLMCVSRLIWHKFLHLLLLTVAAFIFGLYYGRRISIAWISNESDPTRLWSGCRQHASMWNVTPVNIGWTIGTPSRVNEILGQICWADNDEWQVQRERERERAGNGDIR